MNQDLPVESRLPFAVWPVSSTRRDTRQSWLRGRGRSQQGSFLPRAACTPGLRALCVGLLATPSHGHCNPCPHPSRQERPVEVGDWRKNVEAMSGMEGRKKMFDAAKSPTGQ